ncbi:hypothetical protein NQ318_004979 [Aromia moschata]|uniref:DUF4806 domain-containing protein n=1 Tax=Aromia moschata TaxID=1265417 RepID=A0AAV8X7P6_9CUCU|nr:hypothetical protein NQ318_004979 [Aromia moschata]
MAFVLIEFSASEGGGISIVHNEWMSPRKTEVYWPPYKEQSQFNRALKRGEKVNTETWKLFKIARCFYSSVSEFKNMRKQIMMRVSSCVLEKSNREFMNPLRNNQSITKQSLIFSNDKENIETLIQLQERNIELLMHIKEQNKQILTIIGKQDKCSYLSSLGGKDLTNQTNRILKYIFLDEVAKNYNFYGKRAEKEAFSNLTLCSIIIRAVKITHSAASDKEVEDIIKSLAQTRS